MSKKIRVGILFGGRSAEHEVSLQSAKSVIDAIDREKYELVLLGIDRQGRWMLADERRYLDNPEDPKTIALARGGRELGLVPGGDNRTLMEMSGKDAVGKLDVVFPVLHGTFGEDGTVQGLLKLLDMPFVGAGVLGSAVGMDKDVMKRLLRDAGIPIPRFLICGIRERSEMRYEAVVAALGSPLFIKPANCGSSVGVSKAKNEAEFRVAMDHAFRFDHKVIIEEAVAGREIECSVLGNEDPIASVPGEILPNHDFYSYEAKYIDEHGAALMIPAELPEDVALRVREMAVEAYRVLCCEGMARVDMFLRGDGEVLVNEINTLPGFTKISMYPKLWDASGITYPELIDRLIELALRRHERDRALTTSMDMGAP
ncbi:MAG: D-alanine--D-alanine ligase [Spirochaetes bacterium]|nr:D-alanine--D-alanine ligase [Spirochaetota bacterium]